MRKILMACVAVSAIVAAAPSFAASITYKAWFPALNGPDPVNNPKSYTQTNWSGLNQKILLPRFDSTLGTLTGATLTLYADANSSGSVTNNSGNAVSLTSYFASLRIHLLNPSATNTGPGFTVAASQNSPFLLEVLPSLISITTPTVLNAGTAIGFNATGTSATSSALNLFASPLLSQFVGTGNVTLPVFANPRTLANVSGGNLTLTQTTVARAEAIVTYVYTAAVIPQLVAVPEPVSFALVGSALVGLGFARRRRA